MHADTPDPSRPDASGAAGAQPGPSAREDTEELPVMGSPRRRWWRPGRSAGLAGAVAAVVLVLLAATLANIVVARSAEQTATVRASEALRGPVEVQFRGFPVGLRVLTGMALDVDLHAASVLIPETDAAITSLDVHLEGVSVDRAALDHPAPVLHGERGRFELVLGERAVSELAGPVGDLPLVDLELREGVVRLRLAQLPVLDATAEVDDGAVVLRPTAPLAAFASVELRYEQLPLGVRAEDIRIRDGRLELSGSTEELRFIRP